MTTFEYGEVKKGKLILVPSLRWDVELIFPDHRQEIDKILTDNGLNDWTVRLAPNNNPHHCWGVLARGIKLIVLGVAVRDEVILALYHEIVHFKHPELIDKEIEVEQKALELCGRKSSWYLEQLTAE